ncbi:MAG: GNAT family N-acetyltransferase, partial [Longimicrobiales bacterium]
MDDPSGHAAECDGDPGDTLMNALDGAHAHGILTARLALIPATAEALHADLAGGAALAAALDVDVPDDWPPDLYDADAIHWTLRALERDPVAATWLGHYFVLRAIPPATARPLLIGTGGFKGAPDATGTVEIGYSIVTSHRRQGFATEAALGLLGYAFADAAVRRVTGETLPDLVASIGVMEKVGMRLVGAGSEAGVI